MHVDRLHEEGRAVDAQTSHPFAFSAPCIFFVRALSCLQNISKQARGSEGGPPGAAGNQRKTLSDIKDENLGMKEKPDFFLVRATITFFKHDVRCTVASLVPLRFCGAAGLRRHADVLC
jgi:hypothetical protein